jgi:phosphotransferase system  glucose/maltose/N-acetylglucosamine-specific IIC component
VCIIASCTYLEVPTVAPNQWPPPQTDSSRLSLYMSLGLSIGVALGIIFNNLPLVIAIGVGMGVAIGSMPDRSG